MTTKTIPIPADLVDLLVGQQEHTTTLEMYALLSDLRAARDESEEETHAGNTVKHPSGMDLKTG